MKNRRSIRLKGYNYASTGYYFITICTHNKQYLFGSIVDGKMTLNNAGEMVKKQWYYLSDRFTHIELPGFIVMPNHIHGIINIAGVPLVGTRNNKHTQTGQPQGIAPTIGDMIGAFKSLTTNDYIRGVKNNGWQPFNKKIWQRNYHDRIIRDDDELYNKREYIRYNPLKWGIF